MKRRSVPLLFAFLLLVLVGCSTTPGVPGPSETLEVPTSSVPSVPVASMPPPSPVASPTLPPAGTPSPSAPPVATPSPTPQAADPFDLISQESLLTFIADLVAIQPYSGWRNSTSQGEAEALHYVAERLGEFEYLRNLGVELERQSFRVFMGTELWETRLQLVIEGQEIEVPADGLRGPRDDAVQALRFDSDGTLNDAERNPVSISGPVVLVRSAAEVQGLDRNDVQGRIVFLDYAAIDRIVQGSEQDAAEIAGDLLEEEPAGLVLVTRFSNQVGESHGTFVAGKNALNRVTTEPLPPTLYVRLEDLASADIADWDDLGRIESARLTWDVDVFAPASSGNTIARIPGVDPSRAVILGAHIDSANSPGAMDDGSGSAVLLEVARVLDAARVQPPTDLYLAWFGSEEIGLYGSSHFVATHQDLLDQTLSMLQMDMLSYPVDGIEAELNLVSRSYAWLGDDRLLWPEYIVDTAAWQGVETTAQDAPYIYSDNGSFAGFDVPNADLIYEDGQAMQATGSLHYAAHIHDPYDTLELAREQGEILEQMARVMLAGALDVAPDASTLRVSPRPERRVVFVASHTEPVHMTPMVFAELGMALTMEGLDVDLVPYGQALASTDLAGADLVVALPVVDYAGVMGDDANAAAYAYDEAWSEDEIAVLEAYVAQGGMLVLANSAYRLKYANMAQDPNEDWHAANAVASRFGVTYEEGTFPGAQAEAEGGHRLVEGVAVLGLAEGNGIPFTVDEEADVQVLARSEGQPAVALVGYGDAGGRVVVLADVGILGAGQNLPFWQNLARYSR